MIIQPGIGVDNIRLGMTRDEVSALLGQPDRLETISYIDSEETIQWIYRAYGLELDFSSDDQYRLGTVTIFSRKAELQGVRPIGLAEVEIKSALPSFCPDDDFEEMGKDYIDEDLQISLWLSDGVVSNLTLYPFYDDSGEITLWPDED